MGRVTEPERARCFTCGEGAFERVEDESVRGAVIEGGYHGMVVRLEYRCATCGEHTRLIPPGRDEPFPTRD